LWPVLDGARHPADPNLVVLTFEDMNLGEGHFDLLSRRHSRTTAELLMAFRRLPLPAGFMKCTLSYVRACNTRVLPRVGHSAAARSAEYEQPFWGRHPRKGMERCRWPGVGSSTVPTRRSPPMWGPVPPVMADLAWRSPSTYTRRTCHVLTPRTSCAEPTRCARTRAPRVATSTSRSASTAHR